MAGSKAGILNVIIGAKINDFLTKMQVAERQTKRTSSTMKRQTSDASKVVSRSMATIQTAFVGAFAGMAVESVRAAAKFSMAMTKIETLVGVSRKEVDKMRDSVKSMAGSIGKDPQELAEGLFFVTSAGLRGAVAMETLEAAAKASAIGLGDTKDIADATTSILNAYGSEVYSATDATELLLKTVRLGKVEAASLAPSLGRVIPVAQQLGVSMEEVGANIAVVTRVGLSAEESIVALRGVLNTFIKPSAEAAKALEKVGLNMEDLRVMLKEKGLLDTLMYLKETFGDNVEALGDIIPNVRALTNVLASTGKQAESYNDILSEMSENTDNLGVAMKRLAEEDGYKVKKLWSWFAAMSVNLGDAIATPFIEGVDAVSHMRTEVEKLNKELEKTPKKPEGWGTGGGDTWMTKEEMQFSSAGMFSGFKDYTDQDDDAFMKSLRMGSGSASTPKSTTTKNTASEIKKTRDAFLSLYQTQRLASEAAKEFSEKLGENTAELERVTPKIIDYEDALVATRAATKDAEGVQVTLAEKIREVGDAVSQTAEKIVDKYGWAFSFVSDQLSQMQSILYQFHQNYLEDLEAVEQRELESYKAKYEGAAGYAEGLEALQASQAERRDKAQEEFAQKQKALATFQAAILGAQAILQALASMPFPANLAAAGVVGGLAGAQIAAINGAVPAFAGGVMGSPGGMALVGERGPELVKLPAGSSVYNSSATSSKMGGTFMAIDREKWMLWEATGSKHHSFRRAGIS